MTNTPKHTEAKSGRAGGEARGNKYDRVARLVKLSAAQGRRIGAPMIAVEIPARRRVTAAERKAGATGTWVVETRPAAIAQWNVCEECGNTGSCHPREREDSAIRLEQDRIDPRGGYVMPNLQLLCRNCNVEKGDILPG